MAVSRLRRLLLASTLGACIGLTSAQALRRIGIVQGPGGNFGRDKWAGADFVAAMKSLGRVEGRDYVYDVRSWQTPDEAPGVVRALLSAGVEVLVASAPPSILAARAVTDRVPIVMVYSADPVATGLVRSLNRPGGNLTGLVWDHGFDTVVKEFELMKSALPQARRIAVVWDATDSVHPRYARQFADVAERIGMQLISIGVSKVADFSPAFDRMVAAKAQALLMLPSAQLLVPERHALMALVRAHRIPTIAGPVHWDFPGALLVWSPSQAHVGTRAAVFVDRILKGAKPGDLPIEQPTRYELIVNLQVARELGIKLPQSLIVQADRVIE
jgi:putative ABC transport system substrate-binding protein